MNLNEAARLLDLSDPTVSWLRGSARPTESAPLELPDDDMADRLLREHDVDPDDRADVLAARPDPERDPELWWILDRVYQEVRATIGQPVAAAGPRGWPGLPASAGAVGMHLYVWVFLAAWPAAQGFYADRGIPEHTWRTTSSLGEVMRAHRHTGHSGLGLFDGLYGPPLQLRGAMYQLGLLSFNRGQVSLGNGACGHALGVHIGSEPLDPARCDESFALARTFFAQHFPEEPVALWSCQSWLMDPQLAKYLPGSSNIVRFQRRFHLLPRGSADVSDEEIRGYVFGGSEASLDELPLETTLHRAYVEHLRSGRHWYKRVGWMPA